MDLIKQIKLISLNQQESSSYLKREMSKTIHRWMHPFTLRSRKAIGGPTKWMTICAQKSVLLFHSKPRMLILYHTHDLFTHLTKVGFLRSNTRDINTTSSIITNYPISIIVSSSIHQQVCGCIWEHHREPVCWDPFWKGLWTWLGVSSTCHCWTPQTDMC